MYKPTQHKFAGFNLLIVSRKKKNIVVSNIKIDAYAAEGKSIAHLEDGKVLFVENVVPGDTINARITKSKKSWAEGRLTELIEPSSLRVEPFCQHFGVCGGCKWQMLPYSQQLVYKQQQVTDQLTRIAQITLPEIAPILGSEKETFYRNKLEFTFCANRYRTHEELKAAEGEVLPKENALGFHAPGLFDKVVPIYTCYLQSEPTNKLLAVLRGFSEKNGYTYYDYRTHEGWLRNVVLRTSKAGEVLINLVFKYDEPTERKAILDHLLHEIPNITSLHYTINGKMNDSLFDQDVITYFGKGYIEETLENFRYKISPKSFFQTNSYQAEKLYQITRDFAGLTGEETVYDLYCGTGSIGIFCSKKAKKSLVLS